MTSDARWAMAVRILGVLSFVLIVLVVLEGATVRRARAELQLLRTEKEEMKAGVVATWARESEQEFSEVLRRLDDLLNTPDIGPSTPGGLCAGGQLNRDVIARYALGQYAAARAAGQSFDAAANAMREAWNNRGRK